MQAVPIGIRTIEDTSTFGFLNVDDTAYIAEMVLHGKGYFFQDRNIDDYQASTPSLRIGA